MFFNFAQKNEFDIDTVQESPYDLDCNGILMTVYENECNYNALMKAVGLSELKYYQETGNIGSTTVLSGMLKKLLKLFEVIIKKIKGIFKKFILTMNSYATDDKTFLRKYKKALQSDIETFKFTGYNFTDIELDTSKSSVIEDNISKVANYTDKNLSHVVMDVMTPSKDELRGSIIGEEELNSQDFQEMLVKKIYGNKRELNIDSGVIDDNIEFIEDSNGLFKSAKKLQDKVIEPIDKFIKACNDLNKKLGNNTEEKYSPANTAVILSDFAKSYSNDLTVAFGIKLKAYKDHNRQAKAICIKALTLKNN